MRNLNRASHAASARKCAYNPGMDWESPAILLTTRAFAEADLIATAFTEAEGRHAGLVHGGQSRRHAALWQAGNLLHLRWSGRVADNLGSFSAELAHPTAALAIGCADALAILVAALAVADGILPERTPHPRAFAALLRVVASLSDPPIALSALIGFELTLLAELGFGLDLTRCALTGTSADLRYVSPRTGRAVSADAGAAWATRLLALPRFLAGGNHPPTAEDLADGLRLTGHFLARDAFGANHRSLPSARLALYQRLTRHQPKDPTKHD